MPTKAPNHRHAGFTPSQELFPFRSRWFESSAGRIHYVDEGAGQPILMCHGNPTWSFLYRHVIGALRGRFRCIAFDMLGFGLSDRPAQFGYSPDEQAAVAGELVRDLDLADLIVMGHDRGGPVGLSVAAADPARIAGLVLGNTWFWPADRRARIFSKVMSSRPLQHAILKRNLFVERILPAGVSRSLSAEEMAHYRSVQPTPASRVGVAALPRQLVGARAWLHDLDAAVQRELRDKRVLITYPMRDIGFPAATVLPRMRAAFADVEVRELPGAKHFFVEDAPDEVAAAIAARFGG